jgi:hypothetical protein
MIRILLIALAACSLSASPAFSWVSQQQEEQIHARESTGEANSQKQLGGLKKNRQISRKSYRNSHASMRTERTYPQIIFSSSAPSRRCAPSARRFR